MTTYNFQIFSGDLDRVSDLYYRGQNREAEALLEEIDQKISSTYKKTEFWAHLRDSLYSTVFCKFSNLQRILTSSKKKFSNLLVFRSVKYLTEIYFTEKHACTFIYGSPKPHRFFIHWNFEGEREAFDAIFQREVQTQVGKAISLKAESVWETVKRSPRIAISAVAAAYYWPGLTATALAIAATEAVYGIYRVYQSLGNEKPAVLPTQIASPPRPESRPPDHDPSLRWRNRRI